MGTSDTLPVLKRGAARIVQFINKQLNVSICAKISAAPAVVYPPALMRRVYR